jgi:hypothetical protein
MIIFMRRSFRRRSMNMEMVKMAGWCLRLNMFLLLLLRRWTTPLPHLRRQTKIKEKLLLRGARNKERTSPTSTSGSPSFKDHQRLE